MNAERLHAIAIAVRSDLRETDTVELVKQLAGALQNQADQPENAVHQQHVGQFRHQLETELQRAPSKDFSPAWRQVLEETGIAQLLGLRLLDRIHEIFERNQITPSMAHEQIGELSAELVTLKRTLDHLLDGLAALSIGAGDLEPGQCELGVTIPRAAVDGKLTRLARELADLEEIFAPFAVLSTGSRPPLEIRTISSSDFSIFLSLEPQFAACLAVAVGRTVSLYRQLLEIRRLRQGLLDQGVGEEQLAGVDAHANGHMKDGIAKVVDELIGQFGSGSKKARAAKDLQEELQRSLSEIANRIDQGYHIDVRATAPEESDNTRDTDVIENHFAIILDAAPTLEFVHQSGEPILHLSADSTEPGEVEGPAG